MALSFAKVLPLRDSWDSSISKAPIGDYFVICPPPKERKLIAEDGLQAGDRILHPSFGEGILSCQTGCGIWTVKFNNDEEKKISEGWLRKNAEKA